MHACSSLWAVPKEAVDSWRHQLDEREVVHPWFGSPCTVCKASRGCGWNSWCAEYSELHRGGNNVERLVCASVHSFHMSALHVYIACLMTPLVWVIICLLPICPTLHLVQFLFSIFSLFSLHAVLSVLHQKTMIAEHDVQRMYHVGKFKNILYHVDYLWPPSCSWASVHGILCCHCKCWSWLCKLSRCICTPVYWREHCAHWQSVLFRTTKSIDCRQTFCTHLWRPKWPNHPAMLLDTATYVTAHNQFAYIKERSNDPQWHYSLFCWSLICKCLSVIRHALMHFIKPLKVFKPIWRDTLKWTGLRDIPCMRINF